MTNQQTYNHIPALRFPDFANDGEWEDYSIEEVFDIRNGYTPSKSKSEYWENGSIPWFRMEDIRANGNILSDSIQHITPEAIKGFGLFPAYSIIVATSATIGEHALITVESLANQRFTYLSKKKPFENRVDMLYFHYYMFVIDEWCKKNTNTGGFLSVNMSAFRQLRIPIPPLAEQQRIAACLSAVDEMINAANGKLEQLKAYKKGLMQKLFPAKGKKLPELRFKEFEKDGEWEEKKLGELLMEVKETTTDTNKIPLYSLTIDDGVTSKTERYERGFLVTKKDNVFKVVSPNDFVSNPMNLRFGAVGYNQNAFSVCVSGYYDVFRFKEDGTSVFWNNYLKSDLLLHKYDEIAIGSLIEKRRVYFSNLQNLKVFVPSVCEQRKIASCLSIMDDQINAYTEKFALLRQYKKGLMQRMFPQNKII